MKLAFIVQRYGTEILGGSEYHCRLVAERLAAKHDVEVLTTCARDYVTWKNEYPEGPDRIRGVTVRRFAVAETRDINSFNQFSDWIFNNPHTRDDEMEWLRRQGPWSPALLDYITRHHQQYDALVFFTYLYAPTVLGMQIAPGKSILVPTAHDEPAIHLGIYKELFTLPAAVAYNTEVERRFLDDALLGSRRRRRDRRAAASICCTSARTPRAPTAGAGPARRAGPCRRQRRRPAAAAAHRGPRRDVPPAPSAARPVRAVRRPDRSGQGLRGADRVLQQLRAGRRRRVARPDGRQADAAARGAVDPLRGPALGTRAPPGARSGHHRRRARRRTRACRCWRSKRSPSARRSSPTRGARCSWTTACAATPGSSTPTATSSSRG